MKSWIHLLKLVMWLALCIIAMPNPVWPQGTVINGDRSIVGSLCVGSSGAAVDRLSLCAAPVASATRALLNLSNTALSGGSAAGTYIGANPAACTGDFFNLQVANTSNARLTCGGALTLASLIDVSAAGAGQIQFPATQNASAGVNVLDDYEEGTWTPSMTCGTSGTITVNTASSNARYTKVGRVVFINAYILVTSVSAPTGRLTLNTLPFTQVAGGVPVTRPYVLTTNAYTGMAVAVGDQVTGVTIDRDAGTGADPALDFCAAIKAATEMYIAFSYMAAT